MSTTIDEKVVEMRFDNKQFESNVSTTMSTLDKLKQKLSFSGASKGLEDLNSAAKKVDMSGLGNSVETVGLKFNAMYTMADQTLRNITTRVQQTGERMIKALTLDPITTGFQEYETQMNAVQTILANTQSKGSTLDDVNAALKALNTYADQTIYNFTEMTRNIGTFTAAGVDLQTSVDSIKGIANLAAVSGSSSQQASTAMYQLSQALAAGRVSLMDWNSVVNAGMGGELFQNALIRTSELLKTGAKDAIATYGSFRESLTKGEWLTTEVLTETLKQLSGAYTEADLIAQGFTEAQAKEIAELANTAVDAATKVKTFTQLWDVMKEAAQSGWAQTWQIIVGDFEDAKALLTPLAEFFTGENGIITKISEARNALLESALGKSFADIGNKIKNIVDPIKKVADTAEKAIETIENLDEIALKVIRGDYKNTDTGRRDLLMDDGYNWAAVQNRVNEMLGDTTRHSVEAAEAELKLRKAQKGSAETQKELNKTRATTLEQLMEMSDAQLKELGLTNNEVKAFRDLEKYLSLAGISMEEFLNDTSLLDGRVLLINSLKNVGSGIVGVFKAIGQAWRDAFPPMQAETLYSLIAGLHGITLNLRLTDKETGKLTKTGENLRDTLKGVFAILDIFATLSGSVFKVGFKIIQEFFKALGFVEIDILSITAKVGNAIASFRDWLEEHNLISRAIEKLVPLVVNLGKAVVNMVKGFIELPAVQFVIESIRKGFEALRDLFERIVNPISRVIEDLGKIDNVTLGDITKALTVIKESIQSAFSNWLEDHPKIKSAVETIQEGFSKLGEVMSNAFDKWLDKHPKVQTALENLKGVFKSFGPDTVKMFSNIGTAIYDIVSEFLNLESFDFGDVQKVFSDVGSVISTEFSAWLNNFPALKKAISDISEAFSKFGNVVSDVFGPLTKPISEVIEYLKKLDSISLDGLRHAFEIIRDGFSNLFTGGEDIPDNFLDGLVNGLKNGAQRIIGAIVELGQSLLEAIKGVLGIHSPSTEAEAIGGNFIDGLVLGLQNGIGRVGDAISNIANKIKEFLGDIPWSSIFAGAVSLGLVATVKKIADAIAAFSAPFEGLGSIFDGVGSVLDSTAKVVKKSAGKVKKILNSVSKLIDSFGKSMKKLASGASFKMMAAGVKDIAIAIAILVGSVILLSFIETDKLWDSVKVLGVITGIVVLLVAAAAGLSIAFSKLDVDGFDIGKLVFVLIGLSAAMLVIGSVVKKLGTMKFDQMNQGMLGLAGIAAVMVVIMVAFNDVVNKTNAEAFTKLGGILIKMSVAMMLMAAVIKIIGGMEWAELGRAGAGLAGIGIIFAGLMAVNRIAKIKDMEALGSMLLKMAAAMAILTITAKVLAGMEWEELKRAGVGLAGLLIVMTALMFITKIGNFKKVGEMLLQIAGAIAILTIVATVLAGMEWDELGRAAVGLGLLTGVIALLMLISKLGNTKKIGTMLMQMAGAMAILAIVCKMMATMEWSQLGKAAVGMGLLIGVIAALVAITKLAGKGTLERLGVTLLLMSVSIGILAAVAIVLSLIDLGGLAKGIVAVGLLSAMIALMVAATKGAQDVKGTFIGIAIAVGVIAAAIALLSLIDPKKLVAPTLAMTLLMGMFALIAYSSKGIEKSMGTIIVMTITVAAMAGLLALLAKLPVESAIGSAISLSMLLLAVSGALIIVSNFSGSAGKALGGVIALTAMAVPLLAFVSILALMQNIQIAEQNVIALVGLTTALTLLLIPLTLIGSFGASPLLGVITLTAMTIPLLAFVGILALMQNIQVASTNVMLLVGMATALTLLLIPLTLVGTFAISALFGVVALTAMAVPLLAFVGILALMENIQNATTNVNLLVTLMSALTGMLVTASVLGPLALVGVVAITALSGVIVAFGVVATAIGALMEKFPALQTFVDTGIGVLARLAEGLGQVLGSFITGFAGEVLTLLPQIGTSLSLFMMGAMPFINGIKMVDASMLEGVGVLTGAILALTAADLINGVASFLSGGSSFAQLGTELSMFMMNAMPFIMGASMIDPAMMEGVKTLAETVLLLTSANLLESLTSWFAGEASLADFGAELAAFGPSLKAYSDAVAGIDNEAVVASSTAAKNLAEMASMLPNEGGLIAFFTGENSMETFGQQLKSFGSALKSYSAEVVGLDVEAINVSVSATKSLTSMAETIPNMGGLVSFFTGDNDLATFGQQLVSYGLSLKLYAIAVAGLDSESINTSVSATKSLAGMADVIPNMGGLISFFTGDNDLSTFGSELLSYGKALKKYSVEVTGLDTEAISASVTATRALANVAKAIPESGGLLSVFSADSDMSTFGSELKSFGSALKDYSDKVSDIDSAALSNSTKEFKKLVNLAKATDGVDADSIKSFATSLSEIGTSGVDKFVKAFKDGGTKASDAIKTLIEKVLKAAKGKQTDFTTAGKLLISKLADGIKRSGSILSASCKSMILTMTTSIRSSYTSFYSAGSYLVTGFASGISANTWRAEAKARAMANAAEKAAKEALDINSPSKVFMKIGAGVPEGFAKGIENLYGLVTGSTTDMADSAIKSTKSAMSRIADVINGDIDSQPTIRPVLDLSDVTAGAGTISSLLNTNPSVGVMANLRSINSSMNQRSQNGINGDVVSAIRDLRDSLSGMSGDTYSINGVTYDDGSNITEAVKSITRAAIRERRI